MMMVFPSVPEQATAGGNWLGNLIREEWSQERVGDSKATGKGKEGESK